MKIEIMDTTLRDGEQTQGVSYTPLEKLHLATLLLNEVGVDRVEVASARVSKGEFKAIDVNIYLEDWSNGMLHSEEYVYFMIDSLKNENIKRFMLPDTLGILNQDQSFELCSKMIQKYPGLWFDFHAHNDYDLAVANVYSAVKAGIKGIHTTVNGLGERAGNAPLASVIGVLNDQMTISVNIDESKITKVSSLVETFSGIHADGDNKEELYFNNLIPERFGRKRKYALVDTKITWLFRNKEFVTRGLDADQTEAAIKATEKMLNIIETMNDNNKKE